MKRTITVFLAMLLLITSALAVYANAAEPGASPKSAGVDYITAYACTLVCRSRLHHSICLYSAGRAE